jgi:hypothetical protein
VLAEFVLLSIVYYYAFGYKVRHLPCLKASRDIFVHAAFNKRPTRTGLFLSSSDVTVCAVYAARLSSVVVLLYTILDCALYVRGNRFISVTCQPRYATFILNRITE